MKKLFFIKKFLIPSDALGSLALLATLEVDYNEIENGLPFGSRIKPETVKTFVEGDTFVVYGEYSSQDEVLKEAVGQESIDLDNVLGEGAPLPSVN